MTTKDRNVTSPCRGIKQQYKLPIRLLAALAFALPILFASGCKQAAAPETVVAVQAVHPVRGPIAEQIQADAILTPVAQAAIVPKITAPVAAFYVQRGSRVHAGELLAVLDNSDLKATALDSKGAYEVAQGAYVTATKAQIPQQVEAAEVALAQAKATLKLDEDIVQSRTKLLAEGAIPQRDLDSSKATLVQAQGAYETAVKNLEAVRRVNTKAAMEQAQGQLTSARGRYEGAEAQLAYSEIRSPINGVVTERPLFVGETASAGTPLITVMDTTTLIAKAHIAQSQAQQLSVGDKAVITAPGVDKPVPATVALVSPALDPGSTTIEIWLKIDNRDGILKVGTPVKASITGTTVNNALQVPAAAIQTADDGSKFVMVVANGSKAKRVPVKLGIVGSKTVQVISGLTTADQVITVGSYALDPGTKVAVTPSDANAPNAGTGGGEN